MLTKSSDPEHLEASCLTTAKVLFEPGAVVELRVLNTRRGTVSGYFDDPAELAKNAAFWSGKAPGVYVTLNPVDPDLLARAQNRTINYARTTTADNNILRRRWLPVDFDPKRPAGISSTEVEHEAALTRAHECREWLSARGFPAPILADSGNGAHLFCPVDLPNDPEALRLVGQCLKALAFQFGDDTVDVDLKTGNAARIWKFYGTRSCKGDSTSDRPHRMACILEMPESMEAVPVDLLQELAAMAPKEAKAPARPVSKRHSGNGRADFDLERWISDSGLEVAKKGDWGNGGRKWIFEACPFNPEHTDRSAYIVQFSHGAIAGGCQHASCKGKEWRDLRDVVEPGWQDRRSKIMDRVPDSKHKKIQEAGSNPYPSPSSIEEGEGREGQTEEIHLPFKGAAQLISESSKVLWLADRIIPRGRSLLVSADAGVGKSWFALALALAVDQGNPWLDRFPCEQGPVIYVDEENGEPLMRKRLIKSLRGAGLPEDGSTCNIQFLSMAGLNLLDEQYQAAMDRALTEMQPVLVILDTLPAVHSADENSAEGMHRVTEVLKSWMVGYGCSFCLLHHNRKPGMGKDNRAHSYRGSSAIKGFVDSALDLKALGGEGRPISVHHTKSRADTPVDNFIFEIIDVEVEGTVVQMSENQEAETQSKAKDAQDLILDMVAPGEWISRQDILDRGKEAGISKNPLDDARKALIESGKTIQKMDGRQALIGLPEPSLPSLPSIEGRENERCEDDPEEKAEDLEDVTI